MSRNTYLGSKKISKVWSVQFDIKPKGIISGWTNIIHLTTGPNCCGVGHRVPGIWFWSKTNKLHICSGVGNTGNKCYNPKNPLPKNKFTTILIKQELEGGKYMYSITIDGQKLYNIENTKPRVFTNVKIFAADNFYTAANAELRNLEIINLGK